MLTTDTELAAMAETLAGPSDGAPMTLRIPRNAVARKAVHLARIAGGRVEAVRKGRPEKRPATYRQGGFDEHEVAQPLHRDPPAVLTGPQ